MPVRAWRFKSSHPHRDTAQPTIRRRRSLSSHGLAMTRSPSSPPARRGDRHRWRDRAAPAPDTVGDRAVRTQVVVGLADATGRQRRARRRARSTRSSRRSTRALRAAIPGARSTGATGSSRTASRSSCHARSVPLLATLPGVRGVYGTRHVRHRVSDRSTRQIRAPELWGTTLADGGHRDQDRDHRRRRRPDAPFFDPAGLHDARPATRRGRPAYTTAKVIVARGVPAAGNDVAARRQAVRPGGVGSRDARRGDRRGQRRTRLRPRGSA